MPYRRLDDILARLGHFLYPRRRSLRASRQTRGAPAEPGREFGCTPPDSAPGDGDLSHPAMAQREQALRCLFDYNPDAAFSLDTQGRFTAVNRAGEQLSGYSAAELLQMNFSQMITADTLSAAMAGFGKALQGTPTELEAQFARKDGRHVAVHVTGGPVIIDGRIVGVFGIARDITERKRAEAEIRRLNEQLEHRVAERTARLGAANERLEAEISERRRAEEELRQSEARYRALVEQIPAVVYVASLDGNGQTVYVNPQIEGLLGFSPRQCLAASHFWADRLHPEDRDRAMAVRARAIAAGEPISHEYRLIAADGRVVWVHDQAFLISGADGRPVCLQGVVFDITDRVRAEKALRESEQKYRGIVENTQDVIMLTRSDGIITYLSPAARQVLGYEPEELVGRQPWIIHPDDLDRMRCVYEEALCGRARSGTNVEYRIVTKNGQVKWVSHSWSVIPGEPEHTIVSVVQDISARKAAQDQIQRHQEQLRALASELVLAEERERRQLAGDLHDEISQLLTLARIRLGVLERSAAGTDLAGRLGELRPPIEQAIQAVRSLTFQLCPPALYDLGFVPAAEWLAEDMQQRYGLRVEVCDDGADKPLDERMRVVLFRSLREVLINAAKHSGVDSAQVRIRREGTRVLVQVEDAGAGFDWQGHRGRMRPGFGLFSIEERLGYLGGRLEIRSAPGGGTTVTLEAPLKPSAEGAREEDRG
jgi:PAS domain S-box-containing protein